MSTPDRLEDHPGPGQAIADVGGVGELVTRLAHELAGKLNANRHKLHWRSPEVETGYLIGRLLDEVDELVEAAIEPTPDPAALWAEAADVAAFAAFLADRAGRV